MTTVWRGSLQSTCASRSRGRPSPLAVCASSPRRRMGRRTCRRGLASRRPQRLRANRKMNQLSPGSDTFVVAICCVCARFVHRLLMVIVYVCMYIYNVSRQAPASARQRARMPQPRDTPGYPGPPRADPRPTSGMLRTPLTSSGYPWLPPATPGSSRPRPDQIWSNSNAK